MRSSADTHVRSLNRIVDKHRAECARSSDPDIRDGFSETERIVRRRSVFARVSDENRKKALAGYLTLLLNHPTSIVDYKLHLKTLLPVSVFGTILRIRNALT
jgi:hypothetical protein